MVRKIIRIVAIVLAILSVLVSLAYLVLLMLSYFAPLPVDVQPNVLFADWMFIAIPILGLLTGIFLQIASLAKKPKKAATLHRKMKPQA